MAIKLVIVDDAPFIREVVRNLAEQAAIDVVGEAGEGKEAIEVVRLVHPDVVLMDLVMPNTNGVDAIQVLCEDFPKIKIIAFSTLDGPVIRTWAKEAGCYSYLLKPFSKEGLLGAIYSAVEVS